MAYNRIDLHIHTTASDGQYTPSEIVYFAQKHRLDVIAITDHDNTAGIAPAQDAAQTANTDTPLTILPGIELATYLVDPTSPRGGRTVDVLGYLFDPENAPLQDILYKIRHARHLRAEEMLDKLNALGMPLSSDRVKAIAGEGSIGRPHVAQALREAGYVHTLQEAFERYIGENRPAYADRYRLTPVEAIDLLHQAGGVAVLAHPIRVPMYKTLIPELAAHGLDGVEVYYPDHDADLKMRLRVLARTHDLIMTGGSDFHRPTGGKLSLGSQKVPPECIAQLQARAARYA